MADIFEYLRWRGDLTLDKAAFNEVDAVILARFSYIPFELAATGTISDICNDLLSLPDVEEKVLMADDFRLIQNIGQSQRFCHMEVLGFAQKLDLASQTQFAAVTFQLRKDLFFAAYRGTDNTLVGWKEDFNMCFGSVPSQQLAVEYLNNMGKMLPGKIIVGGHSKGGNLAVYASSFCRREIQERVPLVYNFDGPGFHDDILEKEGYQSICSRIRSFVPQSSVVGMMLWNQGAFAIVHSQQTGLLQHDVYSWEMERDGFSYVQTVTNSSRFVDTTLKHWLEEVDPLQREKFVDVVYAVILETNAKTVKEVGEKKLGNGKVVLRALRKLDEPDRKAVVQALRALARCAKMSMNVISKSGRK